MQITDILDNVSKVIVGKEEVTKKVITSILAGGHILLEDVPGMGKTMLAKTLAKSIDCDFGRVQFTPDLLPSDITGIHIYNQKSEDFVLKKGPVFANIILADEINRATPRTQSALLECMEEHQVTIDGDTLQLDEPFIVIATENPIETAGTYPLPEAQLDRFLMKLEMGYPDKEEEITILNRFLKDNPIEDISNVCSKEDIKAMKSMGKTMLAKTLAKSIDCDFGRVQFTPDLLPSDITGIHIYNQKSEDFVLKKGPVFANIILADEINRATPRTQSALLECMEEHQVTIDGDTLQLDEPFIVIATENPIETAGTYPLPEAQLDRFLMKLEMGYPDKEEEITILNRFLKDNPIEDISNVCSKEDIKAMKNEVKNIYIHPSLIEYIVKLAEVTRNMGSVAIGISPRGSIAMVNAARAYAYVNGRNYVVPSDIKELALCVWGHRLVFNTGMVAKENREQTINEALSQVEVPTEEWSNR